jgi:hypothetical protein
MILLALWDGQDAYPLYFGAGKMPTPQESSLNSATPNFEISFDHATIKVNLCFRLVERRNEVHKVFSDGSDRKKQRVMLYQGLR